MMMPVPCVIVMHVMLVLVSTMPRVMLVIVSVMVIPVFIDDFDARPDHHCGRPDHDGGRSRRSHLAPYV
jgi:hypothetical protein